MDSSTTTTPLPGDARGRIGIRSLVTLAVLVAAGVAVLGGVRSFEAVSTRFGSPLVPLTADGMIVACTALRLAALTRGWRLPGSLLVTYVFIAGTIWLNVATATGWADAVAHALAPAAYAVLVEMLAHLLRLHLRLAQPRAARMSALTWTTSPVITTRVWLHLARSGTEDPVAARALVQQVVRMRSRLRTVCPNRWHRFDGAGPARAAALHTIRDGLLTAADVAALLPDSDRLTAAELLARIDRAALATAPNESAQWQPAVGAERTAPDRTALTAPVHLDEPAPVYHTEAAPTAGPAHRRDGAPSPSTSSGRTRPAAGHSGRPDEELVAVLLAHAAEHNDGAPLSQREARKVLGVGFPKARRLVELAGWTDDSPGIARKPPADAAKSDESDRDEIENVLQFEMSDNR